MKPGSFVIFCMIGFMAGPASFAAKATSPTHAIPTAQAAAAFAQARALCSADGGRLWGHSLCVPMMFVEPATREAVLNQPSKGP